MPNIFRPTFEDGERPEGFRSRRARIGYELGTELIGASLWEVPPDEAAYPYHFHYGEEELVVVLSGRPTLRTPEGLRELELGEAIRFAPGEAGAHQILNRGDETASFLAVASHGRADVVVYPDSNKVGAVERLSRPGGPIGLFRREDRVDYFDGEHPYRD